MIRLLADQHIYKLTDFLPKEVHLTSFDPKYGLPAALDGFDALFTRTVTKINQSTLPIIPDSLKLIGTASSGSDHFDRTYLSKHNISVVDAKGCNANAVAEYVITALILWSKAKEVDLSHIRVGVIGVGLTGSAVIQKLDSLQIRHIDYDPPKEKSDPTFTSASLSEILECDVLTFHTPLVEQGEYKTIHWLNDEMLRQHSFALIINAARGGVIDEKALLNAKMDGSVGDYILDVWENEPDFFTDVAKEAFIATPHIAGYSEQAKLNISSLLVDQLYNNFDLPKEHIRSSFPKKMISIGRANYSESDLLKLIHPIEEYDADLRKLFNNESKNEEFNKLRVNRAYRFEYVSLNASSDLLDRVPLLKLLGISTPNH